ncbi:MAG: outer membrane beta-barrel protein [Limisphaerales bacterium]
MKYNAWTLALIGAGVVSLPAVARADEHTNAVLTALSTTTISGYVDTSMQWNPGTGNQNLPVITPNGKPGGSKADGFNLDVLALTLSKPAGEEAWSAGYNATLLFGPDAVGYNNSFGSAASDFSLKDTYVDLHAPLGNGLDVKLGTFTEILGYEVYETGNNPNYTRSYGYEIEPTALTGVLATYQLTSAVSVNGGICDTWSAGVNTRSDPPKAESFKTYMGSLTYTCPTNSGFLSGSTLSGGAINGYDAINGVDKTSLYIGGTFNTPITNVKVGAAYDYAMLGPNNIGGPAHQSGYQGAFGLYLSWQATEKLGLYTRGEYFTESGYLAGTAGAPGYGALGIAGTASSAFEVTETAQYDLWKNVLARLEFRWDHAEHGAGFGGFEAGAAPTAENAFMLAANFVYKF